MRIYDSIHGYIDVDPIPSMIVNTHVFQRLRHISQTGVLNYVFPTATHTRFEHSIGTYHLAKRMIAEISKKQPDLGITDEMIMLVSIAGLCHDLGHLLFSHLFDEFLENINFTGANAVHENRSIALLKYAVETYSIPLSAEQLHVIGDLIYPKQATYETWSPQYTIGKWIFQIVSNPLNSIDVDKFDYLTRDTRAVGLKLGFDYSRLLMDARVIGDEICYSSQCSEDIYQMFFLRYRLHRQIYNHKAVKAIEILIVQVLYDLEKTDAISEFLNDPEKMIQLVDYVVFQQQHPNIRKIQTRNLPKLVFQDISSGSGHSDHSHSDRLEQIEKMMTRFDEESYHIMRFTVGYVGGSTNPLNNVHFYNGNSVTQGNFSLLINHDHREYVFRVYCLDEKNEKRDEMCEMINLV